jgi:hypothetical protein
VSGGREFWKRALPAPLVERIRRRLAVKRYLRAVSEELMMRRPEPEAIDGLIAARRDAFYDSIVRQVLDRTDLLIEQLDRKVEGNAARQAERLAAVEDALAALREALQELGSATVQPSGR